MINLPGWTLTYGPDPLPRASSSRREPERVKKAKALEEADIEMGKRLADRKDHPVVDSVAQIGKLGDQEPLYTAAGVLLLFSGLSRNGRLARASVSMLVAVAAADIGKTIAKRSVRRTRPHATLYEGEYARGTGGSEEHPEQSFPSGHVACTVAASRAFTRQYPSAAPWTAVATGVIALARLAKGAHWPLDVAAGLAIGLGAEALSSSVLQGFGIRQHRD